MHFHPALRFATPLLSRRDSITDHLGPRRRTKADSVAQECLRCCCPNYRVDNREMSFRRLVMPLSVCAKLDTFATSPLRYAWIALCILLSVPTHSRCAHMFILQQHIYCCGESIKILVHGNERI